MVSLAHCRRKHFNWERGALDESERSQAVGGTSSGRSLEQVEESYLLLRREQADMQPCSEASEGRRKLDDAFSECEPCGCCLQDQGAGRCAGN